MSLLLAYWITHYANLAFQRNGNKKTLSIFTQHLLSFFSALIRRPLVGWLRFSHTFFLVNCWTYTMDSFFGPYLWKKCVYYTIHVLSRSQPKVHYFGPWANLFKGHCLSLTCVCKRGTNNKGFFPGYFFPEGKNVFEQKDLKLFFSLVFGTFRLVRG